MSSIKIRNLNTTCGLQPKVTSVVLDANLLLWANISMEKNPIKAKSYSFIRQIDLSYPSPRFKGTLNMKNKARLGRIMGRIIMEKAYSLSKVIPLTYTNYRASDRNFQNNVEVVIHGTSIQNFFTRGKKKGKAILGGAFTPNIYVTTFIDVINNRQIVCSVNDPPKKDILTKEELEGLEKKYYINLCRQLKKNGCYIAELFDTNIKQHRKFIITDCVDYLWGIAWDIVKGYGLFNKLKTSQDICTDYYIGENGIVVSIKNQG